MHKRRAPLPGFIGNILGPGIGVMTNDDAEQQDEAIQDAYEKQKKFSEIIGKQTNLIKAKVNNIHIHITIQDLH